MIWFWRKKFIPPPSGAIPSPPDSRDIPLSTVQAIPVSIPEECPPPFQLRVLEQVGPSCVGFSCASVKAEKERRERNLIDFDGKWIYDRCKEIDDYPGDGTYLRIGMKVLKNKGAKPLGGTEVEVSRYRIGAYAKVDEITFEGLKKTIYVNGAILAGFHGSNEGWQNACIRPPKAGEKVWGHAVALIGYNKDYLIGLNSWGTDWGDNGLFYVPKDYLPFEAWAVLTDLPSDFELNKPVHTFKKNLYYGMKNEEVVWLQKCLKYLNCFPTIIEATGYFGIITLRSVQTFQSTYKIPSTGFVGPLTRAKLNEIFS